MPIPEPHLPASIVSERFELQIPSRPEWIVPTVEYLEQKAVLSGACDESRQTTVGIALHEAVTNSVVHGNLEVPSALKEQGNDAFVATMAARAADPAFGNRLVSIEVHTDAEGCTWTLTDEGPGFDVERVLSWEDDPDPSERASGRGIQLMKALLDDVRFEAGGRRVHLHLNAASGVERRRHPRVPLQGAVRVAPVHSDGTVDWAGAYDAIARNVSAGGIGLLQTSLASTARVLIGIDWDGQVIYLPAEVRNCRAADGVVEIGCRFQSVEAAPFSAPAGKVHEAIDGLLAQVDARQLPYEERRAHRWVPYTAHIRIAGGPATEPTFGFGRDLSRGGIAFLTTAPLGLGPRTLTLPQPDRGITVRAEILRCTPLLSGVFDVGARFVDLGGSDDGQPITAGPGKVP
jgi:anti-sigma regulatory factor (Ser/Thr protein kinase)